MKVLLFCAGSRGDVQPLVATGVALRDAGHSVRMMGSPNGEALARAHGLPFEPVGVDLKRWFTHHAELVVDRPARAFLTMCDTIRMEINAQFAALERGVPWADVVVGGGVVNSAASVAEAHGVPYLYLAHTAQAIPSRLHSPYVFPFHGLPGPLNLACWWLLDRALIADSVVTLNGHRERLGLPPLRGVNNHITPPGQLILAADPELSPPPWDFDPKLRVTGFLQLPSRGELPDRVEAFLADGEAPIYVGFGSMPDPTARATTALLIAAAQAARVRLIIHSGWAGLGSDSLPDTCITVDEVPHDRLFGRVAAVVHHGGSGTTGSAARAGRPQLLVPHILDQFYWGHRVRVMGLGPTPIRRRRLSVQTLSRALRTLLDDPAPRARAQALGQRMRAHDSQRATVRAIEDAASDRARLSAK